MIKSMTAFSREVHTSNAGELVWEARSVNHRYLEPTIRLPEELRPLEPAVRDRLTRRLHRGKIDCQLRYKANPGTLGALRLNHQLLDQVIALGDEVAQRIASPQRLSVSDLLSWPGMLEEQPRDLSVIMSEAISLLDKVLDNLIAAREREGSRLHELLAIRCNQLEEQVARARQRLPEVLAQARQRLLDRLAEIRGELDADRLEQEMVITAQRLDVAEEMDRISAHIAEIRDVLNHTGAVGRRLDFLMQELNREANTLGSKSADVTTTRIAVEMKVLIEQMREQVQNVE